MVNKVVIQSKFKIYFRILYFEGITCWVMPSTVVKSHFSILCGSYFHLFVISECSSIITIDFNPKNQIQTKISYLEILDIPFEKAFICPTL